MLDELVILFRNKVNGNFAPHDHVEITRYLGSDSDSYYRITAVHKGWVLLLGIGKTEEEAVESATVQLAKEDFGLFPTIVI